MPSTLSRSTASETGQTIQEPAIRAAYFVRVPNVGDRINPSVVTAITGRATSRVASQNEPHLLAIGSVMATATARSQVWGTGVMHPDLGIGTVPAAMLSSKAYGRPSV